jgi:phosphosulfolactate synthase
LFEYAYLYGKAEELLAFVRNARIHIEISDGTLDIPHKDKLAWLERFAAVAEVFSEIGGKVTRHNKDWGPIIRDELAAGASMIVVEGREIGPVGEEIREDLVDSLVEISGGHEKLVFESLERRQQLFFLRKLGVNVNLANIRPEDVLTLESFRRGLKEHTLLQTWKRARGHV